jgi:hypothetical protein
MAGHHKFSTLIERMSPERRARSDARIAAMRRRFRFSMKGLLVLTLAIAICFGVSFGPRTYVASAIVSFNRLPSSATVTVVHPRFVDYEIKFLNDLEVADAEESQLLRPEVLARAAGLLGEAKVSPQDYGSDLAKWLKPRLVIQDVDGGGLHLVISHRESWHAGRLNHGRNTMSWKVLVALLTAYQEEALGRTDSSLGTKEYPADKCRHPFLMFHYVDRRLIKL